MNRQDTFGRIRRLVATTMLGLPACSLAAHADAAIPVEPTIGRFAFKRVDIVDGPDPIDTVVGLYLRSGDNAALPPMSPQGEIGSTETAVDVPGGRALVFWSEYVGGSFRVALAPAGDDGFLPGSWLSTANPVDPRPSATFLSDGSALLVYVAAEGPEVRVFRRITSPATGVWGAPEPVSLPGEQVGTAHVTAHGGQPHVVYSRLDGSTTSIVHAIHDGTAWSREVVATSSFGGAIRPQIHSHAGVLWIDWVDALAPTGAGELGWKRRDAAGSWEPTRYAAYDSPFHRDYHVRPGIRLDAIAP